MEKSFIYSILKAFPKKIKKPRSPVPPLSKDQYTSMFKSQMGRCAICYKTQPNKRLAVDHCHTTGRVRGLLCNKCNLALGLFNDDKTRLATAIHYLL